jgi:hypothetical protein
MKDLSLYAPPKPYQYRCENLKYLSRINEEIKFASLEVEP